MNYSKKGISLDPSAGQYLSENFGNWLAEIIRNLFFFFKFVPEVFVLFLKSKNFYIFGSLNLKFCAELVRTVLYECF